MIKDFNVALLGKWCWMMREERDLLCYRVMVACYGEIGGRIVVGGRLDIIILALVLGMV